MYIKSIDLQDFRNYETLSMEPSDKINILYGKNARGKTNLLEAVYTGCTSKSHKYVKERELIRFTKEEAHIKLNIVRSEIPYRIDIHIKKNRAKGIAVNGLALKKASDLLGTVNVIMFSPEDLSLIKAGPAERRRFLDTELCQLDRIYTHDLISYNRVLEQKNRLLKEMNQADDAMLSVYNEQLLSYGRNIIRKREEFLGELSGIIKEKHSAITGGSENLGIFYEANIKENEFEHALLLSYDREKKNGISLVGPHRDDICFKINGIDIRHYGSQGQQRTAALSLKLSEIDLVTELVGEKPVLLLDDVLSELDRDRQDELLDSIGGLQVFLTCTGIDDLLTRRFQMDKIYLVENNQITEYHPTST